MQRRLATVSIGVIGATVLAASLAARPQAPGVGEVRFPTSAGPAAQALFLTGLAQLHNFEYEDAAHEFREAQRLDPPFALSRAS